MMDYVYGSKMEGSSSLKDEAFIANVHGGSALYGVVAGLEDGVETRKKPTTGVLRPTRHFKLKGSAQEFRVETLSFASFVAGETFCDEVSRSGWSAAFQVAAPGFLLGPAVVAGSASIGAGACFTEASQKETSKLEQVREFFELRTYYVPKASFQIHHSQMRLNDQAIWEFRRLQTLADAQKFLKTYGSHIPTREHHVGGILLRGVGVKSGSYTDLKLLQDTANRQFPKLIGNISIIPHAMEVKSSADFQNFKKITSWYKGEFSNLDVNAVVRALGPPTANVDDFQLQLEKEKSSWCIIDIKEHGDDIPIWKLLKKEKIDFKMQRKLLRIAWQRSLAFLGFPRSCQLMSQQNESRWSSVPPEAVRRLEKPQLIKHLHYWVLSVLYDDECKDLALDKLQPREIVEKLGKIWAPILEDLVDKVDHNVRALMFQTKSFTKLVNYIAESTDQRMDKGKHNLFGILTESEVHQLLQQGAVILSEPVQMMLDLRQNKLGMTSLRPLEEVVSPAQLPGYLTELVRAPDNVNGDGEAFEVVVERTIRNCLSEHQCEKVRGVITKYGFDEEDYLVHRPLQKSHVENMIKELEDALSPQTNNLGSSTNLLSGHYTMEAPPYHFSSEGTLTYNRDILMDRPFEKIDQHKRMIDCIRHRTNPLSPSSIYTTANCTSTLSWDDGDSECAQDSNYNGASESSSMCTSPFQLLVQILKSSDLTFQMTLNKLLLEQRYAIPLLFAQNGLIPTLRLTHVLSSLRGVEVKVGNQKIISIFDNVTLPRVFFASIRKNRSLRETAAMASEVLGCHFVSESCDGVLDIESVVEVGVGFYPSRSPNQHLPCLAFCMWGDSQQFARFLNQTADVVIIERDANAHPRTSNSSQSLPDSIKHLYWEANNSQNGVNRKRSEVWGSFKVVADVIGQFLMRECPGEHYVGGRPPHLAECMADISSMHPDRCVVTRSKVDEDEMVQAFTTPKSALQLQTSYAIEANYFFEAIKVWNNPPQQSTMYRQCHLQKRNREILAAEVSDLPVMKHVMKLLSQEDPVSRWLSITQLQQSFDERNRMYSEEIGKDVDSAFIQIRNSPTDPAGIKMLHDAKDQNLKKMLGFENVWRELCHIFIADPWKENIPILAAYYLLDGFPLEILDGEAGMYCKPWIDRVLLELNKLLTQHLKHEPKVFVMSVVGLQSSGKSTLLNTMFGTQLQTSAGRCTRGVYLQLVKSDRQEYDYILLLDTEGIRAPEFFGQENVEAHDNRIATFSVLPADACVVVVSNEDDSGLKDVLSMVMLAYKGSAIAMKSGGWMPSQLFFVYRSMDTNDTSRLRTNRQKLQEHLQKAAFEAASTKLMCGLEEDGDVECISVVMNEQITGDVINSVTNFRVSEKEDESDVKYMGNVKKENMPPGDTPDWAYGTKVMEVREYIHKRVTEKQNWQPHTLTDWGVYLGMVWKCIAQANFELNFKSLVEFTAFEELSNILGKYRRIITRRYDEEFDVFEQQLHNQTGPIGSLNAMEERMHAAVGETIDKKSKELEMLLQNPRWQKWKIQELAHWRDYLHETRYHWSGRCNDAMDFLNYDSVVRQYYQKVQLNIIDIFKRGEIDMDQKDPEKKKMQLDAAFKKVFQRILQEVEKYHKPTADKVPEWVTHKYKYENCESADVHSGSSMASKLQRVGRHDSIKDKKANHLDEELRRVIDRCLVDVNTYSDRCVEEVIAATKSFLRIRASEHHHYKSKHKQAETHIAVRTYLKKRLVCIQQKWDAKHNVVKKLEQERDRLHQYFEDYANEVSGSEMLAQAFIDVMQVEWIGEGFKSRFQDAFEAEFVKQASIKLEKNVAWVSSGVGFRAILDLHLLNIVDNFNKTKNTVFLQWVANGGDHYEHIMNYLMDRELVNIWQEDKPWSTFVTKVKQALRLAVVKAESTSLDKQVGVKVFFDTLIRQIGATVSNTLSSILTRVNPDYYDTRNLDYSVVESTISSRLDKFKLSLEMGSLNEDLKKALRDKLTTLNNNSASVRCQELCPKCTLTCFKRANHSGLHDTVHQPKGLVGVKNHPENLDRHCELSATSCSKAAQLGVKWMKTKNQRSFFRSKWAKYSRFNKYYPTWTIPNDGGQSASVREYIFYNFQEEIVKRYPGSKICIFLTSEYNHNINELRIELENILQKEGIQFEDSRTFI